MLWNEETETELLRLKSQGLTSQKIAEKLGTTPSSVKHKYTRLKQRANSAEHHHPAEKAEQVDRLLAGETGLRILETHAGYGNMTRVYTKYAAEVTAMEIDAGKCEAVRRAEWPAVSVVQADSLHELHQLLYTRQRFDVVDVDPYGFPSRYFPNVLELLDNGWLFVTFPKYGCAQINRITQLHAQTFYDFQGGGNDEFLQKCLEMLKRQGMRTFREVEIVETMDLQKVYRVAAKVVRRSALELCGYEHLMRKRRGGENP